VTRGGAFGKTTIAVGKAASFSVRTSRAKPAQRTVRSGNFVGDNLQLGSGKAGSFAYAAELAALP
jgi:hypothetical protein